MIDFTDIFIFILLCFFSILMTVLIMKSRIEKAKKEKSEILSINQELERREKSLEQENADLRQMKDKYIHYDEIKTQYNDLNGQHIKLKDNYNRLVKDYENVQCEFDKLRKSYAILQNECNIYLSKVKIYNTNIDYFTLLYKDHNDLYLYYKSFIHMYAYLNPIYAKISTFYENLNKIDDSSDKSRLKGLTDCLSEINLDDINEKIEEYLTLFINILFPNYLNNDNICLSFKNLISDRVTILIYNDDLNDIKEACEFLRVQNKRFTDISSRGIVASMFKGLFSAVAEIVVESTFNIDLSDLIRALEDADRMSNKDFVNTYIMTLQKLGDYADLYIRRFDIGLNSIDSLFKIYQDKIVYNDYVSMKDTLANGHGINHIYGQWRESQKNDPLINIPENYKNEIASELDFNEDSEVDITNVLNIISGNNIYLKSVEN